MDSLIHAHIMLRREQKKQLRAWAADRDTSMATLVREAIDYYLRVAAGPSPAKVRRAARDAVGVVPRASEETGEPTGGGQGVWWAGED